jgi:selenocysteine lyase/cysteine desulfurase
VNSLPSRVRPNFAGLASVTYLNTGTVGIMSGSVLDSHLARIADYERHGHVAEANARDEFERARASVASLVRARPDQIAMTRNASDGVNLVATALQFDPSSALLTTDQEHPAVLLPLSAAERRTGSSLRLLSIPETDEALLAEFEAAVASNVALAVFSHVSCETGRRLPVREMCAICQRHGVLSLVDGAQSVGQIPVDVRSIDCDFMTGNGHKWLCGPKGTGFLYVADRALERTTPAFVGDGSIEPRFRRDEFSGTSPGRTWRFAQSAARFEFGTRNWHSFGALADAIGEWDEIGWSELEQHCASLTACVRREVRRRQRLTLHSPDDWTRSSGLVTFGVRGWDGERLSDRLWHDFQVIQRRVQVPNGIRVSIAPFTTSDDVDRLFEAIDELTA